MLGRPTIVRLGALGVLACVTGCGGGHAGDGSCAEIIRWHDRSYVARAIPARSVSAGAPVGRALRPACPEGGDRASSVEVPVMSVRGVPLSRALVTRDRLDAVYVREGICSETASLDDLVHCLRHS